MSGLREALMDGLQQQGAWCGDCEYDSEDGWRACNGCERVIGSYADVVLELLAAHPVEPAPAASAAQTHDLVISLGDCELGGECTCGTPLGVIRVDRSLDELGRAWEHHVMTEVSP